jgi:N-glycosylase/DNA lyase
VRINLTLAKIVCVFVYIFKLLLVYSVVIFSSGIRPIPQEVRIPVQPRIMFAILQKILIVSKQEVQCSQAVELCRAQVY